MIEYISGKKFSIRDSNNTKEILVTNKEGNEKWVHYSGTIDDYEKINECEICKGPILVRRGILFGGESQHNKEICGSKMELENKKYWICYSCSIKGLKLRLLERKKRPPDQWRGSYKLSDGGGGLRD